MLLLDQADYKFAYAERAKRRAVQQTSQVSVVIIQILELGVTVGAMRCVLEQREDVFGGDIRISVSFQISLSMVNDTLLNLNLKGIYVGMGLLTDMLWELHQLELTHVLASGAGSIQAILAPYRRVTILNDVNVGSDSISYRFMDRTCVCQDRMLRHGVIEVDVGNGV